MEEFEIIDIREEKEVIKSWETFIHSHHYSYHKSFFDSSIARHPRRSVESYRHWAMPITYSEAFQEGNPIPRNFKTLKELWDWYKPLIKAEKEFIKRIKDRDKRRANRKTHRHSNRKRTRKISIKEKHKMLIRNRNRRLHNKKKRKR